METSPVELKYVEHPGLHSIPRQNIQTVVHVQGVVGLAQVKEDGMDDRLPHGDELLKQLFLEGGGPRSYPCVKTM